MDVKICRACLNKDQTYLTNASEDFENLKLIYTDLTTLEASECDGLPNLFCRTCSDHLNQFKNFKDTCFKSYHNLKQTGFLFVKTEFESWSDAAVNSPPSIKLEENEVHNKSETETDEHHVDFSTKQEDSSSEEEDVVDDSFVRRSSKKEQKRKIEENDGKTRRKKNKTEAGKFTHKCPEAGCRRSFCTQASLDAHLRIHNGATPGVCDICEKPLSSVKAMRKHRLTHQSVEERSFTCQICFKVYVSDSSLKAHMKEHTGTARKHICDICGLGYSSTSILNNHKNTHSAEKQFKCEYCDKAYRNRTVLYNHKKLYHERKNEVHTCKICDKVYATKVYDNDMLPKQFCLQCSGLLKQFKDFKETCLKSNDVLQAQTLLLKEEVDVSIEMLPLSVKIEDSSAHEFDDSSFHVDMGQSEEEVKPKRGRKPKSKSLICNFCNEHVPTVKAMRQHMKLHKEETTDEDNVPESDSMSDFEDKKPKSKAKKSSKSTFKFMNKCSVAGCGKLFRLQANLEAHMQEHKGGNATVCDICNKPLSSIRSMVRHKKTHESMEERKDNSCPVCYKVYTCHYALKLHMRQHSDTGRSFICEVCGVGFYSNSILNSHKQTHNTTREYKCDQCPKDYKSRTRLYQHVKEEHERNRMIHRCRICDKVLATKKSIFIHCKNVHTVYTTSENIFTCNLCDMKFKNAKILQRHQNLHTGERKFACPLCPKTFAHASILKKHSYFHSGDRPVHCEVCGKGFYQKYALDIHMNIHRRKLIADGVQGVRLYEYNRNRKKNEASAMASEEYMVEQQGHQQQPQTANVYEMDIKDRALYL